MMMVEGNKAECRKCLHIRSNVLNGHTNNFQIFYVRICIYLSFWFAHMTSRHNPYNNVNVAWLHLLAMNGRQCGTMCLMCVCSFFSRLSNYGRLMCYCCRNHISIYMRALSVLEIFSQFGMRVNVPLFHHSHMASNIIANVTAFT